MSDHKYAEGEMEETEKDLTTLGTFFVVNMSECFF